MPKREIDVLENYKAYKELKRVRAIEEAKQFEAATIKKKNFLNEYYKTLENREQKERYHGKLLKEAKDYYFSAALKGIYIGALEAATLTDDALYLAENMVDSYITEKGGYSNIISNVNSDTYLLAKIRRLVEDAAEEDVKQLEDGEKELEAEPDVEFEESPEDEKDTAEVASDTQLTTANITDIVNALNKAGLEVVNKGEDADNFKESQPETPDTKPDMEFEDKPAEETPATEEPATDEAPTEPDNAEATTSETEDDANELDDDIAAADSQPTGDTTEAPATDDAAPEATPADTQEEAPATEEPEATDDEEDELDKDLEVADDNNEKEAEETDDNLDPDSVNVYDDDAEEEDGEDVDFGDEDEDMEDSGEDLGDEDIDDVNDEELGDESDDLGDEDEGSEEEGSEEVEDIDVDGDGEEDLGDVDEPEGTVNVDPHKTMMDELENEKEVQDAIELIRSRVADAEEAFIKRNQEDKKKMDDILSKISQNVATVEKISQNDSDKAEDAKAGLEESTRMFRQKIRELDDRPMSIFNRMTKNISESIIRDPKKANMFINESTGQADFSLLVETSKVMYGFLETLNTLQLESVNSEYITNIINGIN